MLRGAFAAFVLFAAPGLMAQPPASPAPAAIPGLLEGCWEAGDGGTEGRYCFTPDGKLNIAPKGRGREVLVRDWSVDGQGRVLVRSGKHRIVYVVEHLAADGFVLVNDKEQVRLEGHREAPVAH